MLGPVLYLIGILLFILGLTMLGPAFIDLVTFDKGWRIFLFSSSITIFIAILLILTFKSNFKQITTRQAFLFTFLAWTILSGFAAIPFMLSDLKLSFTDAYFETMSGLTTTGASIIEDLETLSKGIHLWRAFLAGLGGIGIVVLAIAVLPMLKIGGMQLFLTESSDKFEKFLPRTTQIAVNIVIIYLSLIGICFLTFWFLGMSFFDALFHAITTLSTGGFSTHDNSFAYFNNHKIEWVASIFMLLGAFPFVFYLKFLKGNRFILFKDGEVRLFIAILLTAILLIILYKWQFTHDKLSDIVRKTIFHTTSFITTAGFATEDITQWGSFPLITIVLLALIGGCSGSTSGGMKVFRMKVMLAQTGTQISQLVHARGIFVPYYNNKVISPTILTAVSNFIFIYIFIIFLFGMMLSAFGIDFMTSFTTAIVTITNTGSGITSFFGPMESYTHMPFLGKWIMIFAMLLGRLEIFSVLVVFLPFFWRN